MSRRKAKYKVGDKVKKGLLKGAIITSCRMVYHDAWGNQTDWPHFEYTVSSSPYVDEDEIIDEKYDI